MLLKPGEKVFIVTRRQFERDLRRHFVGEVECCTDNAVRVKGYVFIFDDMTGSFNRREDIRTRIFPLIDAGIVINVISNQVQIDNNRYEVDNTNQRILTDGDTLRMIVSEFSARL